MIRYLKPSKLTARRRMIVAGALCAIVVAALVVTHVVATAAMEDRLRQTRGWTLPVIAAFEDMRFGVVRVVSSTSETVLLNMTASGEAGEAVSGERDLIASGRAAFEDALSRLDTLNLENHTALDADIGRLKAGYTALLDTSRRLIAYSTTDGRSELIAQTKDAFEEEERYLLDMINGHIETLNAQAHGYFKHERAVLERLTGGVLGGGALILLTIAVYVFYGFRLIDRLDAARAQAEAATRAKVRFLSSMSHEFRTPLNAIIGFSQLLDAVRDETKCREYRRHISESAHHLLDMVTAVLENAQLESGFHKTIVSVFDPAGPAIDAVEHIEKLAAESGIALECSITTGALPSVRADHHVVNQTLAAFLKNACQYGARGGRIVVSGATTADGHVRLSVADDGPGVPETTRPDLFKAFERLDQGHGEVAGLGLSLANASAKTAAMGGRIGYEPGAAGGAVFWIDLPRA